MDCWCQIGTVSSLSYILKTKKPSSTQTTFKCSFKFAAETNAAFLDADIKGGLLYSMKEREMNTINITRDTVVGLLRKRNELVSYIVSNKLPPMLRLENTCKRCFSVDKCTIYGKVNLVWINN